MIRQLIIFNILLSFSPSITAMNNVHKSSSVIKTNLTKCCPMDKYIGLKKTCVNYNNIAQTFSKTKIFDEDMHLTEKSFKDLFTIVPNKFANTTFKSEAIDVMTVNYNVYLTESGVIQVERPNFYNRWKAIPIDGYCIDLDPRQSVEPRFWIIRNLTTFTNPYETSSDNNIYSYLSIATLMSCVFILLVLVVYYLLPELQNFCGFILMAYLFSLFMAFVLLILFQLPSVYISTTACIPLAGVMYFFFLAAFCWMSVMSYDMWCTFSSSVLESRPHRRDKRCKFFMYCLYAWGVPLLMTIFLVVMNSYRDDMKHLPWFITPRIPENGCFLQGGEKLLYFYIPMLILIICNWIFYLMTAFHICQKNRETAVLDSSASGYKQVHRDQKQMILLYIKLSVVMGLSWLLEIVSFLYPGSKWWIISDAYNSLIGFTMFLIFVCKKNILKRLYERCRGRKIMRWSSRSTGRSKVDSCQEIIALQSKVSSQPNGRNPESDERAHR